MFASLPNSLLAAIPLSTPQPPIQIHSVSTARERSSSFTSIYRCVVAKLLCPARAMMTLAETPLWARWVMNQHLPLWDDAPLMPAAS